MKIITRFIFVFIIFFYVRDLQAIEDFDSLDMTTSSDFKVVVKNVGQGSCTIIHNEENNNFIIIDAGSSASKSENLEDSIASDLGQSHSFLDVPQIVPNMMVFISHTDSDHINLIQKVFTRNGQLSSQIKKVILGDNFKNFYKSAEAKNFLKSFVGFVSDFQDKTSILSHDISLTSDLLTHEPVWSDLVKREYIVDTLLEDTEFFTHAQSTTSKLSIFSANAGIGGTDQEEEDSNLNSAVFSLMISGKRMLMMGDATGGVTRKIIDVVDPAKLQLELLVMSHHGADTEYTNNIIWAAATKPARVAISAGYHGGFKHPSILSLANFSVIGTLKVTKCDIPELLSDVHNIVFSDDHGRRASEFSGLGVVKDTKKIINKKGSEFFWYISETQKSIYTTNASGDLTYIYDIEGNLVYFKREQ